MCVFKYYCAVFGGVDHCPSLYLFTFHIITSTTYKQDRLARLLQRTPPATLGDLDASDDDEAPEQSDAAAATTSTSGVGGGEKGKASSLAAAILPVVRRHGLTRAELVLRVGG